MKARPIRIALLGLAGLVAASAGAAQLKLDTPRDHLIAMRKIQCSLKDGEVVTWYWNGYAYSRVPGEPDRLLFAVEGMNIRQCGPLGSANDGSFKMVTREILLYKDPKTGEVLRTWDNPLTGKQVKVVHVANDPVNQRMASHGSRGPALPAAHRRQCRPVVADVHGAAVLSQPAGRRLPGLRRRQVPRRPRCSISSVTWMSSPIRAGPAVNARVGWVRMSDWLPWMEMSERAGLIYFNTAGRTLDRFEDMSASMQAEIKVNYPAYGAPPPLDDERPNETSWTYFRKVMPAPQ